MLHKPPPLAPLPEYIKNVTTHLYFRQSLIYDYLLCPQLSLYRWILKTGEEATFFSAVLGTAGHQLISHLHESQAFTLSQPAMVSLFRDFAKQELKRMEFLPAVSVRFKTHEEQVDKLAPEYCQLIGEYAKDKRNQSFHPTINESKFVLELPGLDGDLPYLFSGTIDQGGFYDDKLFAIRDNKFRESTFKPDGFKLLLNKQLSLYTAGVRWGVPACDACAPQYPEESDYLLDDYAFNFSKLGDGKDTTDARPSPQAVIYNGPCARCKAKLGTNQWPGILPHRSEIIWLRDYKVYLKDQYTKFKKSKARKTISPKTGRPVFADEINPAWLKGYKKGEHRGPAILSSSRSEAQLAAFLAEIRLICKSIREGYFFRREGDHCTSWCRHRDACINFVELDMGTSVKHDDIQKSNVPIRQGNVRSDGIDEEEEFARNWFADK